MPVRKKSKGKYKKQKESLLVRMKNMFMLRSMTNIFQLKNRLMYIVMDVINGERLLSRRPKSFRRRVSGVKNLVLPANLQAITRTRRKQKSKRVLGSFRTTKGSL